jgi:glycosyltransferase involved in cell wall biosynthesis
MKLSVVSPVYKGEKYLVELIERIESTVLKITDDFEIVLVDDASPDNSWQILKENFSTNQHIKGIQLSRNFGQHNAITAGLDVVTGDYVVVIDCDLQDTPEEIENLYKEINKGFDIVYARRSVRNDKFLQRMYSYFFYRILAYLTGFKHDEKIANYGIYRKNVIASVINMRESVRFFPIMLHWVGFRSTTIDVVHNTRVGSSSYSLKKRFNLALDVMLCYSEKPLRLIVKLGFLISSLSLLISFYYIFKWVIGDIVVLGYSSIIISIWFLSGIVIFILGILGLYLGKVFRDVQNRPIYIVNETLND